MSLIDRNKEAKLEELLRRAGDILLDYWPGGGGASKSKLEISQKKDASIVTSADLKVSEFLMEELHKLFPSTLLMSEEEPETHCGGVGGSLCILDPLDGTKHFAAGKANFGILLALAQRGRIEFGALYMPALGHYLSAVKGHGTLLNGGYVRVSQSEKPRLQSIFVEHIMLPPSSHIVNDKLDSSEAFIKLCTGELDGLIIKLHSHKSWDIAPFLSIVEEAGGTFTDERGVVPLFEDKSAGIDFIIASNGLIHSELLKILSSHYSEWK